MRQGSFALGGFSVLAVGILIWVYIGTFDRIELQKKNHEMSILSEIISEHLYDNDMLNDRIDLPLPTMLAINENKRGFIARLGREITAVVLPVTAPDGYSGSIDLLVGIDVTGEILGVRVVHHQETPGLGDRIMLSVTNWLLEFNGKSLTYPEKSGWSVKKNGGIYDQFTGVTVTPRAVVSAVYRALSYFNLQKDYILAGSFM